MRRTAGVWKSLGVAAVLWPAGIELTFAQTAAPESTIELPAVDVVVSPTPVPGAGSINQNKVPAFVSTVTSQDFEDKKSPAVADAITAHVPAAIGINVDGTDLSPDLFYRGFDTSRISGTAQGLAVYQNGVRINEAFGDSTNLDLISPIAIDRADVYTNNPIFGLNALGGAINFTMKNGFTYQGGEAQLLGGSFGRVYGSLQYGKQFGDYSVYFATDALRDGGYRPFGAQNLQRAYADVGYRTQDSEFHAIGAFSRSWLGVQGVTPEVLVDQQYNAVFTTPQTTNNQAGLAQITGRFDVTPTWSLASNFYFRQFDQYHVDGNDADVANCGDQGGTDGNLCLSNDGNFGSHAPSDFQFSNHGQPIPFLGDGFPYGTTAFTATHTQTFGTQEQLTNKDKILDHDNYFVVGGSVDQSYTRFSSETKLGVLNPAFQNLLYGFPGAGVILQTQGNVGFAPVWVHATATYFGVFALDTFNVTNELAVTSGARFNVANNTLSDASGFSPDLNSTASYNRINPVVGFTYTTSPALTFYGGYSEANRAPTPLESQCSNPQLPCVLETALVSDPPLQQVVSHTWEGGARGTMIVPNGYGTLVYNAGVFHITSTNDIVNEASPISGQGFFTNVPETLRQGAELGLQYNYGPLSFYANYAHVDATYQFSATFSSPNNPFADGNGNIFVHPGDRIPGIPSNLAKLGVTYAVTPQLKVTAETVIVGRQYFVGDDANQNPQLPSYYFVNLRATYQATDQIQIFGLINNVTNHKYATFGTFYGVDTTAGNVNQTLFNNNPDNGGIGDARAVTVAQPLSVYGGIKVTF
ncbi:TonB-dependent receptor [Methylocapsa sp. D3K7]|uniref:TonB-dependent receptor n=1 Tax=Methylocapsa sp. D3K7 TaxID=3041435 RepID=UPI00244E982C|nr:TonB-dependent receptor [Methylocapsa sp. D3K7]WGJ15469.1 TonB-dependent receptor [Methylocapsa sp. D3K7]